MDNQDHLNGDGSNHNADLERRLANLWQPGSLLSKDTGFENFDLLHRFKIRKVLGSGAFGIVYLADDLKTDRQVALKIPRPEVLIDDESRNRFTNEAKLAATLKHPGIVELLDAEPSGPTPFIASVYCEGTDLAKWLIEQPEPPPWTDSVALMVQICEAVEYAHQQGVYHRDLKPANIVLASDKDATSSVQLDDFAPKITDFGLAKLAAPDLTNTRSSLLIGTPMYMAPEKLEPGSSEDDAAVDVYSLGVILFELLTGQYPVQGDSYFEVLENIRSLPPTSLRSIRRDLPKQLDKICRTCLQTNPSARYSSVADLSSDLQRALAGNPAQGKETNLLSGLRFWCTRPRRIATAGRFMVVHSIVLAAWVFVVVGFSFAYDVVTLAEYSQQWRDAIFVTVMNIVPSVWAGSLLLRGKRWPAWIGISASLLNIPAMAIAILDKPMLFQEIYADIHPFFAFTVHIMLLMCAVIQLAVASCVIASINPAVR